MKIKDIFPNAKLPSKTACQNAKSVSTDTRCVGSGDIFIVVPRKNFDIFKALPPVEKKVAVFVVERRFKENIKKIIIKKPIVYVANIEDAIMTIADKVYHFRHDDFIFVGVTGTKGKTTVTHLLYESLLMLGESAALIGTVEYRVGKKTFPAINTTPDCVSLRKLFYQCKKNNTRYVIMEISSHGINQGRIRGIIFSRCIFTNLSREHLDYHKTMDEYFKVKKRFFLENKSAVAIINSDDRYGRKLVRQIPTSTTYAIDTKADYRAHSLRLKKTGVEFVLDAERSCMLRSSLIGRHNISNILAVTATLQSLGFSLESIAGCIARCTAVEGRLEEVAPDIFVDYAHTPDSLEKTLQALGGVGYKKIICVFGCGGNRDKGKRRLMGTIACRLADYTFITSDNPRSEDPASIAKAIESGFTANNYQLLLDRREAIQGALQLHEKIEDSCVVVAGKGHEAYQTIGTKKIPFKDSQVIKELLRDADK